MQRHTSRLWLGTVGCALAVALHGVDPHAVEGPTCQHEPHLVSSHTDLLRWHAQEAMYNGRYQEAVGLAALLQRAEPTDLLGYELHTSALLFLLKRALRDQPRKDEAFAACATCPAWLETFLHHTSRGQALARDRLAGDPSDEHALFFLGKLNLNYLWLQLGILDRRTGWDEFWEARRVLEALLQNNPEHLRGRIALAWMDYIVGTSLPRGTRWLLGGGNRKRGLASLREVAGLEAAFFIRAEARFGLWDMEQREHHLDEAVAIARQLSRDFPKNRELATFLEIHAGGGRALSNEESTSGSITESASGGPC